MATLVYPTVDSGITITSRLNTLIHVCARVHVTRAYSLARSRLSKMFKHVLRFYFYMCHCYNIIIVMIIRSHTPFLYVCATVRSFVRRTLTVFFY